MGVKVLMLVHPDLRPDRRALKGTEGDVWRALRRTGHQVDVVAPRTSLRELDRALAEIQPDVVFNLLEEFRDEGVFDFHLVSYLEARGIPYTGCNPRGLIASRSKRWVNAVAADLGVPVPRTWAEPARASLPAFVKYAREHASRGITRANRVTTPAALRRTIARMRRNYSGELVIQEFIEGEEVSVPVWGNRRGKALSPRKLTLGGAREFATERVKFGAELRRRNGIRSLAYKGELISNLRRQATQVFEGFELSGYARIDFRVRGEKAFLIDVNANPNLARDEDFALAAKRDGWDYEGVIEEILRLSRAYRPRL